jgi:hypothetical protein
MTSNSACERLCKFVSAELFQRISVIKNTAPFRGPELRVHTSCLQSLGHIKAPHYTNRRSSRGLIPGRFNNSLRSYQPCMQPSTTPSKCFFVSLLLLLFSQFITSRRPCLILLNGRAYLLSVFGPGCWRRLPD